MIKICPSSEILARSEDRKMLNKSLARFSSGWFGMVSGVIPLHNLLHASQSLLKRAFLWAQFHLTVNEANSGTRSCAGKFCRGLMRPLMTSCKSHQIHRSCGHTGGFGCPPRMVNSPLINGNAETAERGLLQVSLSIIKTTMGKIK